jgi:hypothetical protein
MASALTLLEQYHKICDEYLSHILTGDETWVTLAYVENKEQLKQ